MYFYSKSDREFTRLHEEEIKMVFSGIDCVLNDEQAIYCSSELTTGARLYAAFREHKVKTRDELKEKLGKAWFGTHIFDENVRLGKKFAQCVRNRLTDKTIVITPGPFMAPTWSQPEYLFFWEELLRTRIKTGCFNQNWQFSNGCTFEFAVALDKGLPHHRSQRRTSPDRSRNFVDGIGHPSTRGRRIRHYEPPRKSGTTARHQVGCDRIVAGVASPQAFPIRS